MTVQQLIKEVSLYCLKIEFEKFYGYEFDGEDYIKRIEPVYQKLRETKILGKGNLEIYIRALKEIEDEDVAITDFDPEDTSLWYDVSGVDATTEEFFCIAFESYGEILSYQISKETEQIFTPSQILAHLIYELNW